MPLFTHALRRRLVVGAAAAAGVWASGCGSQGADVATDGTTTRQTSEAVSGPTVESTLAGCSTGAVDGLNAQIIAEVNCAIPGVLSPVPNAANFAKGASTVAYMETPARDALVSALAAGGSMTLNVNSMLRTVAEQYVLYGWYQQGRCGIQLAAIPGNSNHETGLALDTSEYDAWRPTLEAHGFRWFGSADVVHFDYVGAKAQDLRGEDVKAFQRLWNRNNPADTITVDGAYGPATESRLKQSPANGFPLGAACAPDPHDAGSHVGPADTSSSSGNTAPPTAGAPSAAPHDDYLPPTSHGPAGSAGCSVVAAGSSSTGSGTGGAFPALLAFVVVAFTAARARARRARCSGSGPAQAFGSERS